MSRAVDGPARRLEAREPGLPIVKVELCDFGGEWFGNRNDLDLRGILAMLQLDSEVQDLDRRLEAQLANRTVRVWETSPNDPPWDFGYPANAGPELIEDLKNEALI
jgi:hypothetical protein